MNIEQYLDSGRSYGARTLARVTHWVALGVFLLTLAIYWLTAESSASFWDCPEYIANAAMLEPGHPPGNPTWMLAARMATLIAPAPEYMALAVNLQSGLFTALAAMLLALCIGRMGGAWRRDPKKRVSLRAIALLATGETVGALSFAWCDTAWFSAAEAEVYAFSIFCTALCVWIALKWADERGRPHADRLIVLLAYVTGLSIGVHQLNLLCLPAVGLIMLFGMHRRREVKWWGLGGTLLVSLGAIACILFGMMPGMITWAQGFELTAVNDLGLPFHTGCVAYLIVAFAIVICTAAVFTVKCPGWLRSLMLGLTIWLSGIFAFDGDLTTGLAFGIIGAASFYVWGGRKATRVAALGVWSAGFLMLGYGTYITVMIRAHANPPMNEGAPSEIFAFASYLGRDQYGSRPLLHGRTPNSGPLKQERFITSGGDTTPDYSLSYREKKSAKMAPGQAGAKIVNRSGFMTKADSLLAREGSGRGESYYLVADYNYDYRYAPELDMWLPRIVSNSPDHLEAYDSWVGMNGKTMKPVKASEAVDSAGQAVGKLTALHGERVKRDTFRPTYMQNLQVLASYQVAYMYLRYLLWNFSGRQNDIPSQGQIDTGNFITGCDLIDNAMLGDQSLLPDNYGKEGKGHNVYYMLPLLLGVLGIVELLRRGKAGERGLSWSGWLFLMTGLAIVVYLNQTPCEPRERDYSFVGSFWAYAIWIAYGAMWLVRGVIWLALKLKAHERCAGAAQGVATLLALGIPALMVAENYDDHDRSGRTVTSDFAYNVLIGLEPDAILFVNGDNFTFPLWYAQEVEGVRPDVRVVNLAYLNSVWYPGQLMTDAREGKALRMTAKPSDLAYGAFGSAYIGSDTTAYDAVETLSHLYALHGATPRFRSDRLRMVNHSGGDSITVSLRGVSGGKGYLSQQQLLVLDIIATNAASPNPRPVYWSAALPDSHKASFARMNSYAGLAVKLTDSIADHTPDNPRRLACLLLDKYRYGGLDRPGMWVDEPGAGQVRMLRRAIRITASEMLDAGDAATAVRLLRLHQQKLPASVTPYGVYSDRYLIIDEAVETAGLLDRCAKALGRPELREKALQLLRDDIRTLAMWRDYYYSLPAWRRGVTSPTTAMRARSWYGAVEAYTGLGGDIDELKRSGVIKGIDVARERRDWMRYRGLRQLLRDARYPESPDSTQLHLTDYLRNGGTVGQLKRYKEFGGFPFEDYDTIHK